MIKETILSNLIIIKIKYTINVRRNDKIENNIHLLLIILLNLIDINTAKNGIIVDTDVPLLYLICKASAFDAVCIIMILKHIAARHKEIKKTRIFTGFLVLMRRTYIPENRKMHKTTIDIKISKVIVCPILS
ncbi:hypothetical protein ACFL20_04080 [Spirochaetota bacterium]